MTWEPKEDWKSYFYPFMIGMLNSVCERERKRDRERWGWCFQGGRILLFYESLFFFSFFSKPQTKLHILWPFPDFRFC